MKVYKIPIIYQSYSVYEVEANNLEEAVKMGLTEFFAEPDEDYIEDSFEIDDDIETEYKETYNLTKILNELWIIQKK